MTCLLAHEQLQKVRLQTIEEVDCFGVHSKCVPPTFMERRVESHVTRGL